MGGKSPAVSTAARTSGWQIVVHDEEDGRNDVALKTYMHMTLRHGVHPTGTEITVIDAFKFQLAIVQKSK